MPSDWANDPAEVGLEPPPLERDPLVELLDPERLPWLLAASPLLLSPRPVEVWFSMRGSPLLLCGERFPLSCSVL